jgi:hypothetical protein
MPTQLSTTGRPPKGDAALGWNWALASKKTGFYTLSQTR